MEQYPLTADEKVFCKIIAGAMIELAKADEPIQPLVEAVIAVEA